MRKQVFFDISSGVPEFRIKSHTIELGRAFGSRFDAKTLTWCYPAFYPYGLFVYSDFQIIDPEIEFSPEATQHVVRLREQQEILQSIREGRGGPLDHDPHFAYFVKPYKHQSEGLHFAYYNNAAGLLFEPGLGKTAVAVNLIRYLKTRTPENHKTLVLAPKIVLLNWAREIATHSGGGLRSVIVSGTLEEKRKAVLSTADVYITTYDTLAGKKTHSGKAAGSSVDPFWAFIKRNVDLGLVVADESHGLMTPTSNKTKAAIQLAQGVPRRLILTGSAVLGQPLHAWGQLMFLGAHHVESYWNYRNKFCVLAEGAKKYLLGFKSLDILQRRLQRAALMYKTEECIDLPQQNIIDFPYVLSEEQRERYNALVCSTASELESEFEAPDVATAAIRINKLLQICSGFEYRKDPQGAREIFSYKENSKLLAFDLLLEQVLSTQSNKVIVWAKFTHEIAMISQHLGSLGVKHVCVGGQDSANATAKKVDQFENDPTTLVYVGQIATGIGINLVSANYVIYFALDYNLGHYEQSLRRNWRIGQERPVTVYRMLGDKTIEEYIAYILTRKQDLSKTLTSHIHCALCQEQQRCANDGIEPFDPGCIYDASASKPTTQLRVI